MKSYKRKMALIAGISLIVMAVAAGFSYGYVYNRFIVVDDPVATFRQIQSLQPLFLAGLGGWLVIFVTDLLVTWSLYVFFKDVNRNMSLLTALLRLGYVVILGIALIKLISILPLVQGPGDADAEIAGRQVFSYLESFERTWSIGLAVFGVHLLGLGYLSLLCRPIPRLFAYLLLLAGLCYIVVHSARSFLGVDEDLVQRVEQVTSIPMALGELLFAFWLIIRGGREGKIEQQVQMEPGKES
jgi:hypothetical protein